MKPLRSLFLIKKPVGYRVGGAKWGNMRAYRNFIGGVRFTRAETADEQYTAEANSIAFSLSDCLYVASDTALPLTSPTLSAFTYWLGSTMIDDTGATPNPLPAEDPIATTWQITFAAGAISTARGDADDFWKDGDQLYIELGQVGADLLRVRKGCDLPGVVDADDKAPGPISLTPVTNLYNAPVTLSAVVNAAGDECAVTYDVPCTSDGIYNTAGNEQMYNCNESAVLTILSHTGDGTKTLTYTFSGTVNAGDHVVWTAANVAVECIADVVFGADDVVLGADDVVFNLA